MFDLKGKYILFRPEIGRGSFSKVYKAKDKNHKNVAIKRINIEKINIKLWKLYKTKLSVFQQRKKQKLQQYFKV